MMFPFPFPFQLHVLPREMLGISTFGLSVFLLRWLPIKQVDSVLLFFSRLILGDTEKYGLPGPKIGPLQIKSSTGKTPVLDIGALRKIKTGEIKVCDPNTFRKLYLPSSLFDPAALLPLLGSKRKKNMEYCSSDAL